jgi:hypothetical protein
MPETEKDARKRKDARKISKIRFQKENGAGKRENMLEREKMPE